jgi:riboflavin kinase/FMN adenylyltransferase
VKIFNTYEQTAENRAYCVALGSFDGVHVGHQRLIEMVKYHAAKHCCTSMIYTFEIHPRKILLPGKPIHIITNNTQRAEIINEMGIDVLFLESFDKIMNLSAEHFFHEVLVNKLHARSVIVGYNYRFGKQGEGDADTLTKLGKKYGVEIEVIPPVLVGNEVVSSSLIRHRIYEGSVAEIPQYLGRSYRIHGKVIHGKKNGKAMGIRTANTEISSESVIPCNGVYISEAIIDKHIYKSVTNIGVNPTFKGEKLSIETHVLDFEGDLYDKEIEVVFLKRLRDEVSFNNVEDLIAQIKADISARLSFKGL